jgi:hypothetical protein
MKPLGSRRVVHQFHFQSMGLAKFKASKPNDGWRGSKQAVATYGIKFVLFSQLVHLICLCFGEHVSLQLDGLFDDDWFLSVLNKLLLGLWQMVGWLLHDFL